MTSGRPPPPRSHLSRGVSHVLFPPGAATAPAAAPAVLAAALAAAASTASVRLGVIIIHCFSVFQDQFSLFVTFLLREFLLQGRDLSEKDEVFSSQPRSIEGRLFLACHTIFLTQIPCLLSKSLGSKT